MDFSVSVGCPAGYDPSIEVVEAARKLGAAVDIIRDPAKAVAGADVVVTDTWISMGQSHAEEKLRTLEPYQVTPAIMAAAAADALFLHCLPAHRGEEVVDARSEEHTSELQSLMRISYAVFCLKKKKEQ